MDKIDALVAIKELVDKGLIKFSEYDIIRSIVMGENKSSENVKIAETKLYDLIDNKSISVEVFEAIKPCLVKPVVTHTAPRPTHYQSDKPIKGTGVGFVLGFFLSVVGLILGITIGDECAKSGAIKGFITSTVIGVVCGIIVGIIAAVGMSAMDSYYINALLSLFR